MSIVNMLKGILRWAIINAMSDDDKDFPIHQVAYMGKKGDAVAWYPFGYHANPGKETLSLMLAVGANSENRVVMPGSPKERIDPLMPTPLKEGEIIMFHPATKSYVHFLEDGSVEIDSQKDVNIRVAGNAKIDAQGNVDVDAAGTLDLDSVGAMKITAPTILMTGIVSIVGDFDTDSDVSLGVGGEVGLGIVHGSGFDVAAVTSTTGGSVPESDSVDSGSQKVTVVGPIS